MSDVSEDVLVGGLVAAAGLSRRMGESSPNGKLLLELFPGTTILEASLASLLDARCFCHLVVTVRTEDITFWRERLARVVEQYNVPLRVVAGGASRQESVRRGLAELPGNVRFVAVHDGARPLCPVGDVKKVVAEGVRTGAAILAAPVSATLKRAADTNGNRTVSATVDRAGMWAAQTPQVFRRALLEDGISRAEGALDRFTDDSALVEGLGYPVTVVQGSESNIKITTPGDLAFARALIHARECNP